MRAQISFAIFASLLLTNCGMDDGQINEPVSSPTPVATTPPSTPVTPSLPRLAAGPHLGMITGFDPLDPARMQIAQDRYAQALAAGASIGRIQIDWAELEPARGQYNEAALTDAFSDPNLDGTNIVVLVSTLDSDGLTLPDFLTEDGVLRDGLTLASPEVNEAFADFLDWLAPQLMQRDVWLLSIGNEPRGPIEDGLASEQDAALFYAAAMNRWNESVPDIGITVTFTTAAPNAVPTLFEEVRLRSDIATFNFYCLTDDIQVTGPSEWQQTLAQLKADAGDRDLYFQELGCPVGFGPSGAASAIGGSLDNQVEFFEFFGEQIAGDPQVRAATLFQLFDWSPELANSFTQPLRDAGFPVVGDRLEEWLETVGLVRWTEMTDRPAWTTWLEALEKSRAARAD